MLGKKKKESIDLQEGIVTETVKPKKKRKKIKKRYIAFGIIGVVVVLLIVNGLFAKDVVPVVTVSQALKGDLTSELSLSGLVNSETDKVYYAQVSAPIKSLQVKKGDVVKAGDMLIEFDTTDLENQYQQASLQYESSESGYKDTLAKGNESSGKLKNATTDVEVLKQQVSDWTIYCSDLQQMINNTTNQIGQLQTKLSEAQTVLQTATDVAVITDLTNTINSYKQQVTDLTNFSTTAQNKLITGQSELSKYSSELAKQESQKSASEASVLSGNTKEQLKANNEVSKLSKDIAGENLDKAKKGIIADFDGIITDVQVQSGTYLTPGMPVLTLASNKDMKLSITLTKYDLENAKVGQSAIITFAGNEYEGTMSRISKVASTNASNAQVVDADIHINNPDDNIYLGVEAKADITMAQLKNVLLIPIEAINIDKEGEFCYVVENSIVTRKKITTGISSDLFTEIKEGLKEGDLVIGQSDVEITEGMTVMTKMQEQ